MLRSLRSVLERQLGVAVVKSETVRALAADRQKLRRIEAFYDFAKALTPQALELAVEILPLSYSDDFQDLFVTLMLGATRQGMFVEFGASDGIRGSNTYMLESSFAWHGTLAEPARIWSEALKRNRRCNVVNSCVWSESGKELTFRETEDAGLSTIDQFASADHHFAKRKRGRVYKVPTISLNDLLMRHSVSNKVDYISIDTEGSELDILNQLDFDRWAFSVLTVEHNFRSDREALHQLLSSRGYVRAPVKLSKQDDWYVARDLEPQLSASKSQM